MTTSSTAPAAPSTGGPVPFGWRRSVLLHLAPGLAAFAGALALAPLMPLLGLPRDFGITLAFLLLLSPIEFGLLLRAAHRATGSWSPRGLRAVLSYQRPLGRGGLLVPLLLVFALAMAAALSPLSDGIARALDPILPGWTTGQDDPTAGLPAGVIIATTLVALAVDGLLNPIVEELYFRAYLLPRLPVRIWRAVPLSAALFATQHYWQPHNWLLIFCLQLVLTACVVRLRSIRLGIVMHVLTNCLGILLAFPGRLG